MVATLRSPDLQANSVQSVPRVVCNLRCFSTASEPRLSTLGTGLATSHRAHGVQHSPGRHPRRATWPRGRPHTARGRGRILSDHRVAAHVAPPQDCSAGWMLFRCSRQRLIAPLVTCPGRLARPPQSQAGRSWNPTASPSPGTTPRGRHAGPRPTWRAELPNVPK